jgi:hypothetical protein
LPSILSLIPLRHRRAPTIRLMDNGGRDVTLPYSHAPIPAQKFAPT